MAKSGDDDSRAVTCVSKLLYRQDAVPHRLIVPHAHQIREDHLCILG